MSIKSHNIAMTGSENVPFKKIKAQLNKDFGLIERNQSVVFFGHDHDVDTLFRKAQNKHFGSLGFCASLYFNGNIVEKDIELSFSILKFCIENDTDNAQKYKFALARFLTMSDHHSDAISILSELADDNFGPAYTTLAYMYLYGKGVRGSHRQYLILLKKGAKCGDIQSQSAYAHYLVKSGNFFKIIHGVALFGMNLPRAILRINTVEYTGRELGPMPPNVFSQP